MRTPLIIRREASTNAATAVNVTALPLQPGETWLVRGVALDNESGESITVAFGILSMGAFTRVGALATVASGDAFAGTAYLLLREGEQLAAQVIGAALTGPVTMAASGWICTDDYEE